MLELKKKVGSKSYITNYISFPVCSSCKRKFEKSYKVENVFDRMKYISIISLLIATYMVVELLRRGSTFWLIGLLLIITVSLTIIGIVLYIIIKLDPNGVRKYIDLKKTGEISIKDEELKQEIKDYLVSEMKKEALRRTTGIGMIICPKCGSKQPQGLDFCNKCGKELRNL